MEKLKVKHDHTLTDIIKVAIFALFLILPILVFLPNCLYYGFNEHATNTETITINYKYESNEVNTLDDLVEGNIYHLDEYNINTHDLGNDEYVSFIIISCDDSNFSYYSLSSDEILISEYFNNNNNGIQLSYDNYYINLSFSNTNGYAYITLEYDDITLYDLTLIYDDDSADNKFKTTCNDKDYLPQYTDYNVIESVSVNTDDTIIDKVATAWGRMWETPMLSWTDTNTFKFTINAFVTVFGITQESYLANYLTYILVVTCIYLVFDIVLTLTTKLTHLINEK